MSEILGEVTRRPRLPVHALVAPLRDVLGYEIRLEDPRTETERETWLMTLRQEKPRMLRWLVEAGHL